MDEECPWEPRPHELIHPASSLPHLPRSSSCSSHFDSASLPENWFIQFYFSFSFFFRPTVDRFECKFRIVFNIFFGLFVVLISSMICITSCGRAISLRPPSVTFIMTPVECRLSVTHFVKNASCQSSINFVQDLFIRRTVVQNNQEYRLEYWATGSSLRLLPHFAHSLARGKKND